jgi:hypothetical protein
LRPERGRTALGQSRLGIDRQGQAFQPLSKGILAEILEPCRSARSPYEIGYLFHIRVDAPPFIRGMALDSGDQAVCVNGRRH